MSIVVSYSDGTNKQWSLYTIGDKDRWKAGSIAGILGTDDDALDRLQDSINFAHACHDHLTDFEGTDSKEMFSE
jgi:hypothetical protein|tara:strand:+ start:779 stop:1000 length:222 start_codon:yes stop_codon:yes gene_type:complete